MSTELASPPAQQERGAVDRTPSAGAALDSQVVSFRLSNEEYGLDIMRVQEIILMGHITEIPEVPEYIRGLINLRGKVIPIVDLRRRFGLEATDATEHTRIIVVNARESTLGIVVDGVSEVLRLDTNQIEPPPTGLLGLDQAYIKGLVKMGEKIMILLNMDTILSDEDQTAIAESGASKT